MLNLNCVICTELFAGTDDVHVTTCGHMFHFVCLRQWMERSKSCPQCRNKCTDRNIFRVYFNLANLDVSHIDVGSLQEQLDNANLQIKLREKGLNEAAQEIKKLKSMHKLSAKTISALELQIQKNNSIIQGYAEKVEMLKVDFKVVNSLRSEVQLLKQQIENMESVSSIMTATASEVEKLLQNENDTRRLCTWVATLKRELRVCENKKADLRKALQLVQSNLRQELAKNTSLNERISQLESENYQLQEKLKALEAHETMVKNAASNNTSSSSTPTSATNLVKRHTISPTIKENIKKIEESNSPYFNIKSSSIGLMPLFKRHQEMGKASADHTVNTTTKLAVLKISPKKQDTNNSSAAGVLRKTSNEITEKYSILKKPRLNIAAVCGTDATKPLKANYIFNGMGGSIRADPYVVSDDETEDTAKMQRSTSATSIMPRVPSSSSLSSRLKSGGLRSFKVTK